ncbi:MAG TPA: substrate-binding domain-containing protein [Magnetovibrio sp.]
MQMFKNTLAALASLFVLGAPLIQGAQAQEKVFTIGFPQDNMSNDWRRAQVMAVKEVLDQHANVKFIYTDAQGDTAKNIQDIEDMVDQGIDLLMVSPRDAQAMTPVIANVHSRGIPVVLLTRRIIGNSYTTFVSADDAKIAAKAAAYMSETLNGNGNILVLQGVPSATTAIKRTEGFVNEIANHPGMKIVAVKPADYLRAEAIKAVEQALEAGLEFNAIYAQSDSMAAGARLALQATGIDPKSKLIVGIDYIPESREAIRQGLQAASFTYPTASKEAAEAALKILNGESVPKEIEVPSQIVTKDNVEAVDTVF